MKRIWSEDELHEHWSLSPEEQAFLARTTSRGQLGVALLLKSFTLETRFPRDFQELPPAVIEYLALQLETPPETLETYEWPGRTGRTHRQAMREWLGFRTPTAEDAARWWRGAPRHPPRRILRNLMWSTSPSPGIANRALKGFVKLLRVRRS